MQLTDTCPSGAPHRALAGWDLGPVILASPRRDLSMHAPWLARALCVGRLGLLYTLERTKLCAPENIACHIARSHRPLPSLADARLGSLCPPTRAPRRPRARLTAESAPLLLDDGEEDAKLHGYAARSPNPVLS